MKTAVCNRPRGLSRDTRLLISLIGDFTFKELFRANFDGVLTVAIARIPAAEASGLIDALQARRIRAALHGLHECVKDQEYSLRDLYVMPRAYLQSQQILKHCRTLAAEGLLVPFLDDVPPRVRKQLEALLFATNFLSDVNEGGVGDLRIRDLFGQPRKKFSTPRKRHVLSHLTSAKECYLFGLHRLNAPNVNGLAHGGALASKSNSRAWQDGEAVSDPRTHGLYCSRVGDECSLISDLHPGAGGG